MFTYTHPKKFRIVCDGEAAFEEIRARYFPLTKTEEWKRTLTVSGKDA